MGKTKLQMKKDILRVEIWTIVLCKLVEKLQLVENIREQRPLQIGFAINPWLCYFSTPPTPFLSCLKVVEVSNHLPPVKYLKQLT